MQIALVFCIAGCMREAAAADTGDVCAGQLPPAEVKVNTSDLVPHVNFQHTAAEIHDQLGSGPQSVALGMTQTSTNLSLDIALRTVALGRAGRLCARPQLEVNLKHAEVEVWMATEIQHDECVRDVVLKHELKHVQIERDTLRWAAQELESQLRLYYTPRVYMGTEAEIKAQLSSEFETRWLPALQTLLQSSNARHLEHDERDSHGDAEACNGALLTTAHRLH